MSTGEVPAGLGSVSFTYTEREFIASFRAIRIAADQSYDSFVMRLGNIVLGHIMLLSGILVVALWLYGAEGKNGPIPLGVACFGLVLALGEAAFLYYKVYFFTGAC